jgi:hypothetical protein
VNHACRLGCPLVTARVAGLPLLPVDNAEEEDLKVPTASSKALTCLSPYM